MKKKIIAALSALIISVSIAVPVSAVNIFTIADFALECTDLYGTIKPLLNELVKLGRDTKIERQAYYLSAWSQLVKDGNLSVDEFTDYYTQVLNSSGIVIDGVDYTDAYTLLIESTADGLSHDTLVELLFSGGSNDSGFTDDGQPYIDRDSYKSLVQNNPSPIKFGGRLSYKSSLFSDTGTNRRMANLFSEGTFTHNNLREVFLLPFYYDSEADKYYYGRYESYLYMVHGEKDSTTGLVPIDVMIDYCDITLISNSHLSDFWKGAVTLFSASDYRYSRISVMHNNMYIAAYKEYKTYITTPDSPDKLYNAYNSSHTKLNLYDLSDSTFSTSITMNSAYYTCSDSSSNDTGFLFSDTPFILTSAFDFSRIPDTVIIYPSNDNWYIDDTADNKEGDTIYNYYYNDYIFNTPDNPTIPDDGGDDTPSDDVGGGNVTVSGRVEVGGNITIDTNPIDININVNSGSSGTGEAAPSYIDGYDVEFDKYLEKAPEMSDGFINFVQRTLSWLPAEILGLLILGLVISVWLRLVGR